MIFPLRDYAAAAELARRAGLIPAEIGIGITVTEFCQACESAPNVFVLEGRTAAMCDWRGFHLTVGFIGGQAELLSFTPLFAATLAPEAAAAAPSSLRPRPNMAEDTYTIRLDSIADIRGFNALDSALGKSEEKASSFIDVLKLGVGIDLGGRLVTSLGAIPGLLQTAIENGVRFNAVLEGAKLGVAAIIKQFDATGTKSFDAAMIESAEAIELLKNKAMESPATFEQLVSSFQAVSGAAAAANIPLNKQVDLVVLMSQAWSGLGIRSDQIIQESRALLTGNITEDAAAARILGITKADIDGAKAAGQLYEFLSEKMSSFAEAGKRGGQTLSTALSNLEDAVTQLEAKIAEPVFEALKQGVLTLNAELSKPAVIEALRAIGVEVGEVVKGGAGLLMWAVKNADALSLLAHGAATLGVALAAMQIGKVVIGLGLKTAAFLRLVPAIEAETAAVARNTAAHAANAAAAGGAATARAAGPVAAGAGAQLTRAQWLAAQWLAAQREARPGGTTFAQYRPNAIGGVEMRSGVTAAGVAAASRMGTGLVGGAVAGAATAGLVVAIGTLVFALNELRTTVRDGKLQAVADDRRSNDAIFNKLMEKAGSARARDRGDVEDRLAAEKQRLQGMLAGETDPTKQRDLTRAIERLADVIMELDIKIPKTEEADRQAAADAAQDEADAAAAKRSEEIRSTARMGREVGLAKEEAEVSSTNPQERMAALEARRLRQRNELAASNNIVPRPGVDFLQNTPQELRGHAGNMGSEEWQSEALADIAAIEETERAITAEREQQSKLAEQAAEKTRAEGDAAREQAEELAALKRESIQADEDELELLAAQKSGDKDRIAAVEHRLAVEKEMLRIIREQGLDAGEAKAKAEQLVGEREAVDAFREVRREMEDVSPAAKKRGRRFDIAGRDVTDDLFDSGGTVGGRGMSQTYRSQLDGPRGASALGGRTDFNAALAPRLGAQPAARAWLHAALCDRRWLSRPRRSCARPPRPPQAPRSGCRALPRAGPPPLSSRRRRGTRLSVDYRAHRAEIEALGSERAMAPGAQRFELKISAPGAKRITARLRPLSDTTAGGDE